MSSSRFGAIYGLANSPELQISNDDLHALVYSLTRKDSLKKLNEKEIHKVVVRLSEMKDSVRRQRREQANSIVKGKRGTQNQRKKIYVLMKELGWNEVRIQKLAKKMFKVDVLEWLTYVQCSDLIEALKAMIKRKQEQESICEASSK